MAENENEVTAGEESTVICDTENPMPDNAGSIQVMATKDKLVAKIYYNFGADLAAMVELFGNDVVFSYAKGQMVIRLQAAMRSRMLSGGDVAGLTSEFKPGIALPKAPKDMGKATENYFMTLSKEEQDQMISKLMDKKGA